MIVKWSVPYREITAQLLSLAKKNKRSPGAALFSLLNDDPSYIKTNAWLSRLKEEYQAVEIDPIQLFCSFNNSKQNNGTRIKKINQLLRVLGSAEQFPEIDLGGCPSPFTIRMGSAREQEEQKQIWTIFRSVASDGRQALTQKEFDQARRWYGIEISAFTIFLFWIDSGSFVPLDKHTVDYLITTKIITGRPDTFFQYQQLLDSIPQSNIANIVDIAYQRRYSRLEFEAVVPEISVVKTDFAPAMEQQQILPSRSAEIINDDFRWLGLNILPEMPENIRKVLLPGDYICYACYDFFSRDKFRYDPNQDLDIYSSDKIKIKISAVVGPNGSGKSTITELFYAAVNNLAYASKRFEQELKLVRGLHMDLFFKTTELFRLTIRDEEIQIFRYENYVHEEYIVYEHPKPVNRSNFKFEQFFYTIAVNYAHFSLNSRHLGTWLDQLFHKNDGYQIPLVINPFRRKGNIDVNREHALLKSRLLINLLEPVDVEEEGSEPKQNMRQITEKQGARGLLFGINSEKFGWSYEFGKRWFSLHEAGKGWDSIIGIIYKIFKIGEVVPPAIPGKPRDWIALAHNYLIRKVVNIATSYKPYREKYFDEVNLQLNDIEGLITLIETDTSHITFKFRQTVNFLKYHQRLIPLVNFDAKKPEADLEAMSVAIEKIKIEYRAENYRTLDLLPPSFIDTDIILNDGEPFQDLSSGEKQRIYTVSSLVYHLINIDSVADVHGFTHYRFVNIIFDEVELYFHPEMQRSFIHYLLNYLGYIELNLSGLNFIFITHSPFILSDIPKNNILRLGAADPEEEFGETLAANVHDLLARSFFLKQGFMGEYIKKQVQGLTNFLRSDAEDNEQWNKAKVKKLIASIGEPLIQDRLDLLFELKYNESADREIIELETQLNQLRNAKNKRQRGAAANGKRLL